MMQGDRFKESTNYEATVHSGFKGRQSVGGEHISALEGDIVIRGSKVIVQG